MSITVVSTTTQPVKDAAAKGGLSDSANVEETETAEVEATADAEAEEETGEESETELADAGEEEDAEPKAEEVKPKKKGGFQKKLERKDREIDELKQQLAAKATPAKTESTPETVKVDASKEPNIDDFDSIPAYTKAVAKWTLDQDKAQKAIDDQKAKTESEMKSAGETYQTKLKEFKKTATDFDDAIDDISHIRMVDELAGAIITCDEAPEIMYHLAKNPAELERINKLSPFQIAKEIGKIEAKLQKAVESKKTEVVEEEETATITKAPAPISTVSAKGQPVKKTIYNANSQKEYEAIRMQQRQKKA